MPEKRRVKGSEKAMRAAAAKKSRPSRPQLFIGTAGWTVPREHQRSFAREGKTPSSASGLERYASALRCAEINTTFYRRHKPGTFERWRDSVPEDFEFAVKMPGAITHETNLSSPRAALDEFLGDVRHLGKKLGPILVQLPPSAVFDARRCGTFFRILRDLHAGPIACEPRHESWYEERVSELFARHDIARVVADPARPHGASEPAGSKALVYLRLHGSPRRYWSPYDHRRLEEWAESIARAPKRSVVWCVFDNTASGAAAGDALKLLKIMKRRSRGKGRALREGKKLP